MNIDINGMNLDSVDSLNTSGMTPAAMLGIMKGIYAQTEQESLKREIMSVIHKMIMDTIKKIGQAAS